MKKFSYVVLSGLVFMAAASAQASAQHATAMGAKAHAVSAPAVEGEDPPTCKDPAECGVHLR